MHSMPQRGVEMEKDQDEYLLCLNLVSHLLEGQSLHSQRCLENLRNVSPHIHSGSPLPAFPTNVLTTSPKDTSKTHYHIIMAFCGSRTYVYEFQIGSTSQMCQLLHTLSNSKWYPAPNQHHDSMLAQ